MMMIMKKITKNGKEVKTMNNCDDCTNNYECADCPFNVMGWHGNP